MGRSTTVLRVQAISYSCVSNYAVETETFGRAEVRETADTVTIETWVAAPTWKGFWQGSLSSGMSFPAAEVHLGAPLGARDLLDPACSQGRYQNCGICRPGRKV